MGQRYEKYQNHENDKQKIYVFFTVYRNLVQWGWKRRVADLVTRTTTR